jgi:transposase-like protein
MRLSIRGKNGHTHTGKQNFKCRDCGRQFVTNPSHQPISQLTRELIDRLLLEKISLFWNRESYRSF